MRTTRPSLEGEMPVGKRTAPGALPSGSLAEVAKGLRSLIGDVRDTEPLRRHVSFRIGGPADVLALPRSADELRALATWLFAHKVPFVIIGQGTNVLIADAGIRGVVVKIGKGVDRVRSEQDRLTAEAGAGMPHLARRVIEMGLSGLEFAAGIPASVGGAVVMNGGAHGHAMAEIVASARVLTPGGEEQVSRDALGYAYRSSALQGRTAVVVEATLQLHRGDPQAIRAQTEAWLLHRSQTQPIGPPSSGCVFRNPPGDHAGRLIESVGAKGETVGDARVSEIHANYVLNTGKATATDVLALMDKVSRLVMEKSGVRLEPEIQFLGEFPESR